MDSVDATYVITLPNTDPGHAPIRDALLSAAKKPGRVAVEALGSRFYWGLLNAADAMLGNSSSAIIEGAALGLPAVNLGDRQKGRLRGQNVIDVPVDAAAIAQALVRALAAGTQTASRASKGPFGEGRSAERIVEILGAWRPPFSMSGAPAGTR
jgi:UDP-N-acetylglucosamine 2-epimerase